MLTETGHDGYTSAGIGMRNLGYGTIDLSGIPDGAIDGTAVTGTQWASGDSPCWWTAGANFAYEADVSSLVHGNGAYDLSGFSSGDTNGQDPWDDGTDKRLANRKPASVVYPQVLLYIQAGCWAAVSALGVLWMPIALSNNDIPLWQEAELLGLLALAGGLAAAKVVLARRVHRIRSARTRRAVIITELAMTCFGLLWLLIPAYGFIVAGFSGACLSLAAVLCMTRPRARLYFNHPDPLPVNPDPGALSRPASFRQLTLTSPGLAVI